MKTAHDTPKLSFTSTRESSVLFREGPLEWRGRGEKPWILDLDPRLKMSRTSVEDDRGARLTVRDGRQHVLTGHNIVLQTERGLFLVCDAC